MIGSPSPSLGVGSPSIGFRALVISFMLSLKFFAYLLSWLSNSSNAFASAALKHTCPLLGTGFPDGDNAYSFGGILFKSEQPVFLPCSSYVCQKHQPDEGRESNKAQQTSITLRVVLTFFDFLCWTCVCGESNQAFLFLSVRLSVCLPACLSSFSSFYRTW